MIRLFGLIVTIVLCVIGFQTFNSVLPIPVKFITYSSETEAGLKQLNAPTEMIPELTEAIDNAARATNTSPLLLVALIHTESTFKIDAQSNKNYKGLMQTPWASKKWSDVDILIGARILREKLDMTKNDLIKALSLYKGGNNPVALKQAIHTMDIYKNLQKTIVTKI